MRSRQAEHYRRTTLASIRAAIPADVPLVVEPRPAPVGGFDVRTLTGVVVCSGRAEVVRAFLAGYTAALDGPRPSPPHVVGMDPPTDATDPAGRFRPARPVDDGREP